MDDLWKELQDADDILTTKMRAQYGAAQKKDAIAADAPRQVDSEHRAALDPLLVPFTAGDKAKRAASSASAQQTAKLALMKASEATSELDLECDSFQPRKHGLAGSDVAMTRIVAAASNAPTLKAAQTAVRQADVHDRSDSTRSTRQIHSLQQQSADEESTATDQAQPVRAIDYDDDEDLANALQRDIAGLADSSPVVRQACTRRLAVSLFGHPMGLGPVSESASQEGGDGPPQQAGQDCTSLALDVAAALQAVSSSLEDPEAAAVAALQGTSHSGSVPSAALVPLGLRQTKIAMDPAYTYAAHELSDVAAMIVGRTDRGEAVRHAEGGLVTTTAASTGITRALAQAMRADPLRHWPARAQQQAEGGGGGVVDTQHVRNLLRALWPRLQKPLLRCLGDPWEGVRLGAFTLLSHLLTCGAVLDFPALLPLLLPALVERAGLGGPQSWAFDPDQKIFARDSAAADAFRRGKVLEAHQGVLSVTGEGLHKRHVGEPSEVGRAALARTVFALLEACSRDASSGGSAVSSEAFSPYIGDVAMIAHALAVDTAPDVRVAGCTLLLRLCDLAPLVMRFFAVAAVKSIAVCGGLDHRHAKVRLASLDAVDALVSFHDEFKGRGAGTEAILPLTGGREANVVPVSAFYGKDVSVNYFAKLTIDANPAVRLRFVHALGGWITRLPDRLDWWPYNLPYLLSALGDESPVVSAAALEYLEAAGVSHETEHAAVIMERSQYGLDGDPEVAYDRPLPHPFTARGRPRIGVRLFVRAHARRFLKPVLAELVEFAPFGVPGGVDTRARAAALLVAMMVMEEEQATGDAHLLVKTLVKGVYDAEPAMRRHTRTASRLLGRYFDPKSWLVFLTPYLTGEARTGYEDARAGGEALTAAAALTVLWLALQECMSRLPRVLPHVAGLVQVLASPRLSRLVTPPPAYSATGHGTGAAAAAALARTQAFQARVRSLQALYSPDSGSGHQHASVAGGAQTPLCSEDGAPQRLLTATAAIASKAKHVAAMTASSTQTSAGHARSELSRALLACVCVLSAAVGYALDRHDTATAWASTAAAASGGGAGPKLNGMQQSSSAAPVLSPGRAAVLLTQLVLTLRGQEVLSQAAEGQAQEGRQVSYAASGVDEDKLVKAAVSYLKRDDDVNVRPIARAHRWEGGAEDDVQGHNWTEGKAQVVAGEHGAAVKAVTRVSSSLLCMADEALYRLCAALGEQQGPRGVYSPALSHAGLARVEGVGEGHPWHVPACAGTLLAQPIDRFMPAAAAAGASVLWEYLLIVPCLGEYPAHGGWHAHVPEHALLASLTDAVAVHTASEALRAVVHARVPMLLDLGMTVLQACPYYDASQTVQAGAKGVSAAAVSTLSPATNAAVARGKVGSTVSQREDAWAAYLLCLLPVFSGMKAVPSSSSGRHAPPPSSASSAPPPMLAAVYDLLSYGLASSEVMLQQWPDSCLPQAAAGPHDTPTSLWSTPVLASLSSAVLCLTTPSTPPPSVGATAAAATEALLAVSLAWSGAAVLQPSPPARAAALLAAASLLEALLGGGGGETQPESRPTQRTLASLARQAWKDRIADAEEVVSRVAAGPYLLSLCSLPVVEGEGAAAGLHAVLQEALTSAAYTGLKLTDFMGEGTDVEATTMHAAPTVGDVLLGSLMQVAVGDPSACGQAAREWLKGIRQESQGGRAEGAVEMAKALVEHCNLLSSLPQR